MRCMHVTPVCQLLGYVSFPCPICRHSINKALQVYHITDSYAIGQLSHLLMCSGTQCERTLQLALCGDNDLHECKLCTCSSTQDGLDPALVVFLPFINCNKRRYYTYTHGGHHLQLALVVILSMPASPFSDVQLVLCGGGCDGGIIIIEW